MNLYDEAVAKIDEDLAWRGPNGKCKRYVMLERAQAQALNQIIKLKKDDMKRLIRLTWHVARTVQINPEHPSEQTMDQIIQETLEGERDGR